MKRGDVILVRFPHPSGQRGKKRPAVVVQSDSYASVVRTVVVAEVTIEKRFQPPFPQLLNFLGSLPGSITAAPAILGGRCSSRPEFCRSSIRAFAKRSIDRW